MYGEKKTLSARKETFKKRKLSHSLFVPSIVLGCSLFDYLSVGVFILFLFVFFFLLFIRVDVHLHVLSFFRLVVINSVDNTK